MVEGEPSMATLLPLLFLGFFLGMRHATDPDHVVAVTTIVSRERSIRGAAAIGALWGVGHTVTIALVGGAIIAFGIVIPPRVGLSMELSVAVMLIVLGAMNLTGVARRFHELAHGEGDVEVHAHDGQSAHRHVVPAPRLLARLGLLGVARPLIIGLVHGLAGSAAIALLVLTTVRDARWAVLYLLLFGVGTIAGMMTLTSLLAVPFAFTAANKMERVNALMGRATSVASVVFGLYLAYRIGVVDGLFGSSPVWTPELASERGSGREREREGGRERESERRGQSVAKGHRRAHVERSRGARQDQGRRRVARACRLRLAWLRATQGLTGVSRAPCHRHPWAHRRPRRHVTCCRHASCNSVPPRCRSWSPSLAGRPSFRRCLTASVAPRDAPQPRT